MPLQLSRIQAVCFDVDGTLSDSDDVMVAQITDLLKPLHILFPGRDLNRVARAIVMEAEAPAYFLFGMTDLIGLDEEILALNDWIVRQSKKIPRPFQLVPGTTQMLEKLAERYPLSVVSARDTRTTMDFLTQFNLVPYFKVIATDQTCEHTKPFPDPILWAARELGVLPEACLMVGDTSVDIRAGRAAGTQTVGVLCGFGEERELREHHADLILHFTAELAGVLGR